MANKGEFASIILSDSQCQQFRTRLLSWYQQCGRTTLPWQQHKTPYRVWLSEVMLQQTQVKTVIPYFEKFTATFSDVASLAMADLDTVLHLWTGLGYYSRARNLHRAAEMIMMVFGGKFPEDVTQLQQLPGIGRSTAGAILSLSFNRAAAILDGNVKRVLIRYYGIEQAIDESRTIKQLWQLAEQLQSQQQPADYSQAIMDMGALICRRHNPSCNHCPFKESCCAYQNQKQLLLPNKKANKKRPSRHATFLIIENERQEVLLVKRPPVGIWGGLWAFPEQVSTALQFCQQYLGCEPKMQSPLPSFRHSFSHFHLMLQPVHIKINSRQQQIVASEPMIWYNNNRPSQCIGLPQPIKKLLQQLRSSS